MSTSFRMFIGLCLGLLGLSSAFAHGSGLTFEKRVGDHYIDIGYDIPFAVGDETLVDFAVYDMNGNVNEGLSEFTELSARIQSGEEVLWEKTIQKPEFGKVFAVVTPAAPGPAVFHVRFLNDGVEITSAEFPMEILEGDNLDSSSVAIAGIFAALTFIFAVTIAVVFFPRGARS